MDTFEVKSGKLVVIDPCYKIEGAAIIEGVKNGTWDVEAEKCEGGHRIAVLRAFTGGCAGQWRDFALEVGVDSGQAGIFDREIYPEDETGEYGDLTTFYGRCCQQTLSEKNPRKEMFGVVDGRGVVSSSGYGDGLYSTHVRLDQDGLVTGIAIMFLQNEDDDEDDEEDDLDVCDQCGEFNEDCSCEDDAEGD